MRRTIAVCSRRQSTNLPDSRATADGGHALDSHVGQQDRLPPAFEGFSSNDSSVVRRLVTASADADRGERFRPRSPVSLAAGIAEGGRYRYF
jgi:hypothetical protein